ncbi:MAG: hypothetical protein MUP64_07580, partial [Anaerolineae bacterium]|nr:hypothetical protein [Anaerolineae bacterium]
MGPEVQTSSHTGQTVTACPQCGGRLTHLQGATGRISLCHRCGWSRADTAEQPRPRTADEE